jgi:NAD+ kinase
MPRLLKGDYWLEGRMMLRAEHLRKGKKLGDWEIVNEAVIGRGTTVRPVRLTAHVNNCFLTTYVADGLIVSTATGSTAYALAVGGPILPPSLRNILIIPIAPHLSFDRGVVLHEGSHVVVTVETDHQAALSVDGQSPIKLLDRDQVEVFSNEHSLQFVRFQDPGYFYRNLMLYMNKNPFAKARR